MQNVLTNPAANVRRPTHSFLVKAVAVCLFTAFTLAALLGLGGAALAYIDRAYSTQSVADSQLLNDLLYDYNNRVGNAYANLYRETNGHVTAEALSEAVALPAEQCNYRYVVTDEAGAVLCGNIAGQTVQKAGFPYALSSEFLRLPSGALVLQSQYRSYDSDQEAFNVTLNDADAQSGGDSDIVTLSLTVQGYLLDPPAVRDDLAARLAFVTFLRENEGLLLALGTSLLLLAILLFVFLLCAAGRHRDSEQPRRGFIDRIPFDLLLAIGVGVAALMLLPAYWDMHRSSMWELFLTVECVLITVNILYALMLCMTFAARIKTRTFLRNNICVMIVLFFYRILRGICRFFKNLLADLPLLWRGVAAFFGAGLFLLLTFVAAQNGNGLAALLCVCGIVALFVLTVSAVRQADRLKRGAAALARGELSEQIDTARMLPEFRKHGENLNSVAAGMNAAVNERMKSERMKTDLITNVSHDLKTPLTSIVSYIDLLKKEDLHNETAAGYVAVLDRQAARLKKLTEDLVEASKASSGALKVCLTQTNLSEILSQSLAEYADRLAQSDLTPVLTRRMDGTAIELNDATDPLLEKGAPLRVQADGRLLWRVFDNLLNNIVKYALPGTRVYIDVVCNEKTVAVVLKNISREPLNIPVAELTERFVRGDASRSTEGSGLGLSIAKSLAELQHAGFALDISGDLFTATVTLERSPADAPCGILDAQMAQTNPGGDSDMELETARDSEQNATNLLTQAEKTEASIEAAKARVDANEK